MAKCRDCDWEMKEATSCSMTHIKIGMEWILRDSVYFDYGNRCHDCGIENKVGNFHHFGCDMEKCPKCKGQLISCGCQVKMVGKLEIVRKTVN